MAEGATMSRTIYRDADHPRARTGRFTQKVNDAPVGSLDRDEPQSGGLTATPTETLAAGERAVFSFAGQDEEAATFHGQTVEIVRPLDPSNPGDNLDAEVGTMYRVRADSGQTFDAFADELTRADGDGDGEIARSAPAGSAQPGVRRPAVDPGAPAPRQVAPGRWDALDKGIHAAWDQADRDLDETLRAAAGIFD